MTVASIGRAASYFAPVFCTEIGASIQRLRFRALFINNTNPREGWLIRGFSDRSESDSLAANGGLPCGQGLHFVRTMMQPSFGP